MRRTTKADQQTTVTCRIPLKLKRKLQSRAERETKSFTDIIVRALENELNDEPPAWWNKLVCRQEAQADEMDRYVQEDRDHHG